MGLENLELLSRVAIITGAGTIAGVAIGYAIKKMIKFLIVVVGIFLAAVIYVQYHGMISIKWDRIESSLINTISGIEAVSSQSNFPLGIILDLGIFLSSGLGVGIIIGFMKG